MKKIYACFLALVLSFTVTYSQTVRPEFPFTDGWVSSIVIYGNAIYIGGYFSKLTYSSGISYSRNGLAAFDATTGVILPWNPNSNGPRFTSIDALAAGNNVIYIGGYFGLVAVDPVTGAIDSWNPHLDWTYQGTSIREILPTEAKIYLAGNFTNYAGDHDNIVVLDALSGQHYSGFERLGNNFTTTLALKENDLYVGGQFSNLGTEPRYNLAALNATTGAILPWNPSADSTVYSLASKDNTVYASGSFTGFGYDPVNKTIAVQRKGAAALDATTGAVLPWNPNVIGNVYKLDISGDNIYLGGIFTSVGGQSRNNIAMVDAITGAVSPWNPNANGWIRDIVVDGNTVFVGGTFSSIAGQSRPSFAALTAPSAVPNCLLNDTQAPAINNLSTSASELWPANKKMKDIWIDYTTTDNCPSEVTTQLSITSNEPITTSDWKIIDNHHIQLKAERAGNGNGRIYTITIIATDQAGNKATKSTTVLVPHDQGKKINVRGQEDVLTLNEEVLVKAQLNPSRSYFTLTTQSNNTNQKINLRLYDISGRLLEVKTVAAGQSVQMGKTLNAGVYLLEYSQAGIVKQTKLIKQ